MGNRQLGRLVQRNLRRNLGHNVLSAIGIVVGIGALSFFLALDAGVRSVVLGEIFPVDRVEIIPPKATLFGMGGRLTDQVVSRLANPSDEVGAKPEAAYAKMQLSFPARGWGGRQLLKRGRDFYFEVSGFCDGMDARIVAGEFKDPYPFVDWLAKEKPEQCGAGNACPDGRYCVADLNECHKPVPVLVSKHLIELYNGSIAPSHPGMPKIPNFLTSIFRGARFTVELGRSYLGSQATQGGAYIQRKFQLVGISDKAIALGITVPLGYIKRWNARYAGDVQAKSYSSVVLKVASKKDITPLVTYAKGLGFDVKESEGEKIGLFITLATLLFSLISGIIVLISAINIAHTFMMLIADRRREIGVLRAVGATRGHIRAVILGEAAVIGLIGGIMGIVVAMAASGLVDWYSANHVADFPFKPESYFSFTWTLSLSAVGFAIIFCVLGALLPAQGAARLEPADALRGN